MRLPASKRVNYQKIGFPYPFCPSWIKLFEKPSTKFSEINQNTEILVNLTDNSITSRQLSKTIQLHYLVPVLIEVEGPGVPSGRSFICIPLAEDLEKLVKRRKLMKDDILLKLSESDEATVEEYKQYLENKEMFEIVETEHKKVNKNKFFNRECEEIIRNNKDEGLFTDQIRKDFSIIIDSTQNEIAKISREIIGFVTSGGYSFSQSKGVGKGFICVNAMKHLINQKKKYMNEKGFTVLLRNHSNRHYYFGKIDIFNL
jgi:hypothetical protein